MKNGNKENRGRKSSKSKRGPRGIRGEHKVRTESKKKPVEVGESALRVKREMHRIKALGRHAQSYSPQRGNQKRNFSKIESIVQKEYQILNMLLKDAKERETKTHQKMSKLEKELRSLKSLATERIETPQTSISKIEFPDLNSRRDVEELLEEFSLPKDLGDKISSKLSSWFQNHAGTDKKDENSEIDKLRLGLAKTKECLDLLEATHREELKRLNGEHEENIADYNKKIQEQAMELQQLKAFKEKTQNEISTLKANINRIQQECEELYQQNSKLATLTQSQEKLVQFLQEALQKSQVASPSRLEASNSEPYTPEDSKSGHSFISKATQKFAYEKPNYEVKSILMNHEASSASFQQPKDSRLEPYPNMEGSRSFQNVIQPKDTIIFYKTTSPFTFLSTLLDTGG